MHSEKGINLHQRVTGMEHVDASPMPRQYRAVACTSYSAAASHAMQFYSELYFVGKLPSKIKKCMAHP